MLMVQDSKGSMQLIERGKAAYEAANILAQVTSDSQHPTGRKTLLQQLPQKSRSRNAEPAGSQVCTYRCRSYKAMLPFRSPISVSLSLSLRLSVSCVSVSPTSHRPLAMKPACWRMIPVVSSKLWPLCNTSMGTSSTNLQRDCSGSL